MPTACIHKYTHILTGGTPVIERSEPQTAQAKQAAEEQWCASLNSRCQCNGRVPCGDKYKAVLQRIRAPGAMSSSEQRKKLLHALSHMKRPSGAGVCHSSAASAACDHVHMPRELLPRLGIYSNSDTFPYLSQATVDDVRAMRYLRTRHSTRAAHWAVLQQRLQQYAATGAGTVAEAIVYNDCYWLGQVAHEEPSGARTQAAQRRWSAGGDSSTAAGSSSGSGGTSMEASSSSSTDRGDVSDNSVNTAVASSSSAAPAAAAAVDGSITLQSGLTLHPPVLQDVKEEPMFEETEPVAGIGSSSSFGAQSQPVMVKREQQ
jgi:hypothetical protein